jgi:hypothetical protein
MFEDPGWAASGVLFQDENDSFTAARYIPV